MTSHRAPTCRAADPRRGSRARAAGRLIVEGRPDRAVEVTATKSSATDIVTEMDQASERLLVEHDPGGPAGRRLPRRGGRRRAPARSGVTWVIDPIDGTVNYLYELPGVRRQRRRAQSVTRSSPAPS